MAAHNFVCSGGSAVTASATVGRAAHTQVILCGGSFKATILADGTVQLSKLSSSNWAAMDQGPFSQKLLLQLWQDLANLGLRV